MFNEQEQELIDLFSSFQTLLKTEDQERAATALEAFIHSYAAENRTLSILLRTIKNIGEHPDQYDTTCIKNFRTALKNSPECSLLPLLCLAAQVETAITLNNERKNKLQEIFIAVLKTGALAGDNPVKYWDASVCINFLTALSPQILVMAIERRPELLEKIEKRNPLNFLQQLSLYSLPILLKSDLSVLSHLSESDKQRFISQWLSRLACRLAQAVFPKFPTTPQFSCPRENLSVILFALIHQSSEWLAEENAQRALVNFFEIIDTSVEMPETTTTLYITSFNSWAEEDPEAVANFRFSLPSNLSLTEFHHAAVTMGAPSTMEQERVKYELHLKFGSPVVLEDITPHATFLAWATQPTNITQFTLSIKVLDFWELMELQKTMSRAVTSWFRNQLVEFFAPYCELQQFIKNQINLRIVDDIQQLLVSYKQINQGEDYHKEQFILIVQAIDYVSTLQPTLLEIIVNTLHKKEFENLCALLNCSPLGSPHLSYLQSLFEKFPATSRMHQLCSIIELRLLARRDAVISPHLSEINEDSLPHAADPKIKELLQYLVEITVSYLSEEKRSANLATFLHRDLNDQDTREIFMKTLGEILLARLSDFHFGKQAQWYAKAIIALVSPTELKTPSWAALRSICCAPSPVTRAVEVEATYSSVLATIPALTPAPHSTSSGQQKKPQEAVPSFPP